MKVLASAGTDEVAVVYIAQMAEGKLVEFVESVQPPLPREKKWVLIVSTLFGCPVGCLMCDTGGHYDGKLSADEMLSQIDFLVRKRFPDGNIPVEKFKIQFARMGEPSLNPNVLEVLEELPLRYSAPALLPSISTVAPASAGRFFERLLEIKERRYRQGRFQLQFSIHTTDERARNRLVPIRKWGFAEIAAYGERFFAPGDRKITLNFALARNMPVEPEILREHFDPDKFLIKITPLNPTYRAAENNLASYIDPGQPGENSAVVTGLRHAGYEVIVSIGEVEENSIGSNCGQYVLRHLRAGERIPDGYTYAVHQHVQNPAAQPATVTHV